MTTEQILTGIKTWVLNKLSLKQDVINDLASIRSGAQAGATAVQPSDLSEYFNDASYDTSTHRINFYHGQDIVAYVDASPFIVDGMVDDVRIENGYLVIDFNTASGKQDISIPLTDIFDPSNYYNKAQTDTLLGNKVDKVSGKGLSTNDYTNAEKEKLSGLQNYDDTQVRQLIGQKQDIIQDLEDIRSGASAGATAVQPSTLNSALSDTVAESGAYDVTANNNNAKFASLSALLSSENLNTLIPSAKRKGGMSIKFVLSSENKYVQFRYMLQYENTTAGNQAFLDTANWQSMNADDEPTAGSDNLVKSGGVKQELQEITAIFNRGESETLLVSDEDGNVGFEYSEDGLNVGKIHEETENKIATVVSERIGINTEYLPTEFGISDPNGNIIFYANSEEVKYIGQNGGGTSDVKKDDGYTGSDIVYNILYGQSLAVHGTIVSSQNMHSLVMFSDAKYILSDSIRNDVDNDTVMNTYFGGITKTATGINGSSIAMANQKMMELLRDENGIDISMDGNNPLYYYQLLGFSPSYGGAAWSGLANRLGWLYKALLQSVRFAKKYAEEQNKTFSVGSLCYMQGENSDDSDDTVKLFYDKMWVLFSNLNYDIKNITGQSNDVQFFPYQLASQATNANGNLGVPLAQLQIALDKGDAPSGYTLEEYVTLDKTSQGIDYRLQQGVDLINRDNIHMGAILNSLDYSNASDHTHASANSYLAAGAQWGVQLKRTLYDNTPIVPIHPVSHKVIQRSNDYIVVLNMEVPIRPLVFDTENDECQSQRATNSNFGFSILDSNSNEIVTNVLLRRGQEIIIECSSNPTGLVLTYAKDGWEMGGNLRDSQNIEYNMGNFTYAIHNWCPTFSLTI